MSLDKKNEQGQVHMNLIQAIGRMQQIHGQYSFPITKDIPQKAYQDLFLSC